MDWRDKVNRLVEQRRLTVAAVAELMGRSPRTVYPWLRQGRTPSDLVDALRDFAHALDVDLEWLVDDDQDWPPPHDREITEQSEAAAPDDVRRDLRRLLRALDDDAALRFLLCQLECWEEARRSQPSPRGSAP